MLTAVSAKIAKVVGTLTSANLKVARNVLVAKRHRGIRAQSALNVGKAVIRTRKARRCAKSAMPE
jgi:hypothetical protein